MRASDRWTLMLAIAGTALVWLALLSPLVSAIWLVVQRAVYEMGLLAAALLLASSLVAGRCRALMAAGLVVALVAVLLQGALMREWDLVVALGPSLATVVPVVFVTYLVSQLVVSMYGVLLIRRVATEPEAGS